MHRTLKSILKPLLRAKYNGLNQRGRPLEKYVYYDDGYSVVLGANDGVKQSNRPHLEKHLHWRGLLVGRTPHNFLKCRQNRSSDSKVCCAACLAFEYDQEFVRIPYSHLNWTAMNRASDISVPHAHVQLVDRFVGTREFVFEFGAVARTLDSLVQAADAPQRIDFLAFNVEGAELRVLRGAHHEAHRCKYILVECRDFPRLNASLEQPSDLLIEERSGQDYLFTWDRPIRPLNDR